MDPAVGVHARTVLRCHFWTVDCPRPGHRLEINFYNTRSPSLFYSHRTRGSVCVMAQSIPEGFRTITPYFTVRGVPRRIEFLKQAFEAVEVRRSGWRRYECG